MRYGEIRPGIRRLFRLAIRRPAQTADEMDDEIRLHLQLRTQQLVAEGMTPEAARAEAERRFGLPGEVRERLRRSADRRDRRLAGGEWRNALWRDVHYAVRGLRRHPTFALVAVLCLALGIGVNTAVFGVINALLLRPMPVRDPERLVLLSRARSATFSVPTYRAFQAQSRAFAGLAATLPMESDLDVDGESRFITAEVVTANYADVVGVRPALGRWFSDDAEPGAVISHAVWQREFHLRPDVLGRRIRSESQAYTVVGVAPPDYPGVFAPLRTDLWVPLRTRPALAAEWDAREGRPLLMLFGRLRRGATAGDAAGEVNASDARVAAAQGRATDRRAPIVAEPVRGIPSPAGRGLARTAATLLAAVVALVLVIACVNVGHLLLARGAARQREFAVRRALGASRSRLLRQLLTESLALAAAGGACGVVLAVWTNEVLEVSAPSLVPGFPVHLDLSLDWHALAFATAVSLVTSLCCGLFPARRTARASGLSAFRAQIAGAAARRRPVGLLTQVALSLVLLFVAGSVLRALLRLQDADPGFAVGGRLYAYTFLPSPPFTRESGREFYVRAIERVRAVPGVRRAALASRLPLTPGGSACVALPAGPRIPAATTTVGSGYFDAVGTPLLAGRAFDGDDLTTVDAAAAAEPVVVNEALARRLSPGAPAVGARLLVGCDAARPATVVGVVRDAANRNVGESPEPHVYRSFARHYAGGLTAMIISTSLDPGGTAPSVRHALLGLEQGIRVYAVEPLGAHVARSYAQVRWQASVLTGLGLLALLLAAVGLYGVIAYRVSLRTREIGVRIALGATRRAIFREVLGHGLATVLLGVGIGEVLTATVTAVVGSRQAGIGLASLPTHVGVGVIWIAVAVAACYAPASRAARTEPVEALRHE